MTGECTRANQAFEASYAQIVGKTDRMFLRLFVVQWIFAVGLAFWISPTTWDLDRSSTNPHVYFALIFGGILTLYPGFLILTRPGWFLTRQVVAVSQMLFSVLLIHLTGGRIETHFHVFGSLAFLAFYRDGRVMFTATLITALSHGIGGNLWPASVYADMNASWGRTLEHVGWVVFENIFLLQLIRESLSEIRSTAARQTQLEIALEDTEKRVVERTAELQRSQEQLTLSQMAMATSAKNAALGEMAGQAAHEINTPLGALVLITQSLIDKVDADPLDRKYFHQKLALVMQISDKMAKIIRSMRKMAGDGSNEVVTEVKLRALVEETILLCEGRYKRASIIFGVDYIKLDSEVLECRSNEISQLLINLLNNAHDAVKATKELSQRWVKLKVSSIDGVVRFRVEDGGPGVPEQHRDKLFTSSFTTKSLAEGTGFGLPICRKIAEKHNGRIFLDSTSPVTSFVLEIPARQPTVQKAS